MIYILQFIICGVVIGLHIYFRKLQSRQAPSAALGVNVTAILLVALVLLFVFFPGLFRGSGIDTLDSDINGMARIGAEAGEYLAQSASGSNVMIVRYRIDSDGDGRDGILEQQQAFIDGLNRADGVGTVREVWVDVPPVGAVNPTTGQPLPWFTRDELNRTMGQASKGEVVVLLTGLPFGVSPAKAIQAKDGVQLIILSSNANELRSGMNNGTLLGGILERRISEMDDQGRYLFITPQNASVMAGG